MIVCAYLYSPERFTLSLTKPWVSAIPWLPEILCYLLLAEFGQLKPEFGCIPHLFSTGNNFEKLKRWEKVDKLVKEESEDDAFRDVLLGWLALLSHALLDHKVSYQRFLIPMNDGLTT